MKIFLTSDHHFGHGNIIKHCRRPFSSAEEMDAAMIANWNTMVGREDIVYHLGDFAFVKNRAGLTNYISRLNGRIVLIKGNHDDKVVWKNRDLFYAAHDSYLETSINGVEVTLCHYPLLVWNKSHYGSLHAYGHVHQNMSDQERLLSMNVCVENTSFAPISFEEFAAFLAEKQDKIDKQ